MFCDTKLVDVWVGENAKVCLPDSSVDQCHNPPPPPLCPWSRSTSHNHSIPLNLPPAKHQT